MLTEASCFGFGLQLHRFITVLSRLGNDVMGWGLTALFGNETKVILLVLTPT